MPKTDSTNLKNSAAASGDELPLSALIAEAVEGVIVIDGEGTIRIYNAAAERIFGYSSTEVRGKNVKMLMPSPHREQHDGYLSRHRLTGHRGVIGIAREVIGRRKDGTAFPMLISVGETGPEEQRYYIGIFHDVTERRRWEAALIEHDARLQSILDPELGTSPASAVSAREETLANRRLRLLAQVGETLASSLEFENTLSNIAQQVIASFADVCIIDLVDAEGNPQRRTVLARDPANFWACDVLQRTSTAVEYSRISHSVLKLGKAALIPEITPELLKSWGSTSERLAALEGIAPKSAMIAPLIVHRRLIGAISCLSSTPRSYTQDDLRVLTAIADLAACFLDNARLYREARNAESKLQFIAGVGETLATTLEFEDVLTNIGLLIISNLADVCILNLLGEDGLVRRRRVFSRDDRKAWISDVLTRMPLGHDMTRATLSVLETRKPALFSKVSPELLRSWAANDKHLAALEAIAPKSAIIVPLTLHGRLLGAISMISSDAARSYGPDDLHVAEAIAVRSAFFLENARLYHAAKISTKTRDDVIRVIAHDLRNPLTVITSTAGVLRRGGADAAMTDEIRDAAGRMDRLIQNLLDVARLQVKGGTLPIRSKTIDTARLVSDAQSAVLKVASSSSLKLRVNAAPDLPPINGDYDQLVRVLENLVANAIKFTKGGGRVTIGAKAREDEVLFSVADTGAGIASDQLSHIFEPFWQAPDATQRGVGLGLSIVKGIVEAHGGRIWVESAIGEGTTFFFTIPLSRR